MCTSNRSIPSKSDADKLSESRRIVVAYGLRISERFEDGVSSENLLGEGRMLSPVFRSRVRVRYGCEILYDFLRVLSLSRTRFTTTHESDTTKHNEMVSGLAEIMTRQSGEILTEKQ